MFVRMKTGARAGEVCEVEFAVGLDLVEARRAERVYFDDRAKQVQMLPPGPEVLDRAPAPATVPEKRSKKKRR
jgi:hypothetical protein